MVALLFLFWRNYFAVNFGWIQVCCLWSSLDSTACLCVFLRVCDCFVTSFAPVLIASEIDMFVCRSPLHLDVCDFRWIQP